MERKFKKPKKPEKIKSTPPQKTKLFKKAKYTIIKAENEQFSSHESHDCEINDKMSEFSSFSEDLLEEELEITTIHSKINLEVPFEGKPLESEIDKIFSTQQQFAKKKVSGDGDCLFNSLILSWSKGDGDSLVLRSMICDYMEQNANYLEPFRGDDQEPYHQRIARMRNKGVFGSNFEIFSFSAMMDSHVLIFQDNLIISQRNPLIVHPFSCSDPECNNNKILNNHSLQYVKLYYNRLEVHYDCVFDKQEYTLYSQNDNQKEDSFFVLNPILDKDLKKIKARLTR